MSVSNLFEVTINHKPVGKNRKNLLNFIHQINEMNRQTPGGKKYIKVY